MANYITVSALNNYLKRKFEADIHLGHVYLKGEMSNCKIHSRGHIYFSLKDDTSVISAIMFETNARLLSFEPKDGTKVFAEGKVTVYEGSGKYQIVVTKMQPDGLGDLFIAYEKLKKALELEGLFDKTHKKTIPRYPMRIGIVTAPTGAAIRDILSTIKRRYPLASTILFPALVQGEMAKDSIVAQINRAQEFDLDVLIIGRGGGSIEDLWAFNEEIVARAIYSSKIPTISAVGHEVDFTIADFVADMRAPTPTGAAEMAVPNLIDVYKMLENYMIRMQSATVKKIELYKKRLDALQNAYVFKNPLAIYEVKEQKLSGLIDKMENCIKTKLRESNVALKTLMDSYILRNPLTFFARDRENMMNLQIRMKNSFDRIFVDYEKKYELLINKLELLNPLAILKKGYSVVTKGNDIIKDYNSVEKGDKINIRLATGHIKAKVEETKEN